MTTYARQYLTIATLLVLFFGQVGCGDARPNGRDAILVGNSMAPTLWGEHFSCECEECEFTFRVAAESNDFPSQLRCSNCGGPSVVLAETGRQPADRVRVEPVKARDYVRWDVVAARVSIDQPAVVKRVVGLPGETLSFRDGDVFANNAILCKPLEIARRMRIPVYDSKFRSGSRQPQLRPSASPSHWKEKDLTWFFGMQNQTSERQWLKYHPRRCVETNLPEDQPVPLEDWYSANASVNRSLNPTNDFWLAMNCEWAFDSQFQIQVNYGTQTYLLEFNRKPSCISLNGIHHQFVAEQISFKPAAFRSLVEICTFDQRLTVLFAGQKVLSKQLSPSPNQPVPLFPFRVAGQTSALTILDVRLWRDIHYTDVTADRPGSGLPSLRTDRGEFVLLGDNVPVSIDSRHWPKPNVSKAALLGRVVEQD